jgi:hypothetical protein
VAEGLERAPEGRERLGGELGIAHHSGAGGLPANGEPDQRGASPGPLGIRGRDHRAEAELEPTILLEHEAGEAAGERWPDAGERRIGWRTGRRGEIGEVDEASVVGDPQDGRPPLVRGRRPGETDREDGVAAAKLLGTKEGRAGSGEARRQAGAPGPLAEGSDASAATSG